MDIHAFWKAVLDQTAEAIPAFFAEDAVIRWHCTNEQFTVEEFVKANCEYPDDWAGEIERALQTPEGCVTATHVHTKDGRLHFHVVSFMTICDGKISALDEYWGDDGPAPRWRRDMKIGRPIQ